MTKWQWIFRQLSHKLWIRAGLFCLIGVFTAFFALIIRRYIPADISQSVGADAVDAILQILASSMLAVTIFSLNTIVSAFAAASSSATPRATKLLLNDSTAQNALSTFLGSFLFSLVGIISLHMGIYGENGRVVLFLVTLIVILVIVVTLLQWIDYLSKLGRVGQTIDMVEAAARSAMKDRIERPYLGGAQWTTQKPGAYALSCPTLGYIEHVDIDKLSKLAEQHDLQIWIEALPGAFNDGTSALAHFSREIDPELADKIRKAFTIGGERAFDQDPRYGLIVLSEIASRALSPAVNDPGTAIDVIGTSLRVLAPWVTRGDQRPEVLYPRVYVPALETKDLFEDIYSALARDAAGTLEVGIRLQKALASLAAMGNTQAKEQARQQSALALEYTEAKLTLERDKQLLRALALV